MLSADLRTDLSGWIDSRVKVFEQASLPCRLVIDQDLESLIRVNNQRVESGRLCDFWVGRVLEVLLFPLASFWVLVSEDKVDLVGCTALVWTKHDCEWGLGDSQA